MEEKTLKVLSALSGTSRTGKHPLQKSLEAHRPDSPAPRPPFPSLTPPLQPHLQLGLPWVAVSYKCVCVLTAVCSRYSPVLDNPKFPALIFAFPLDSKIILINLLDYLPLMGPGTIAIRYLITSHSA